MALIVCLLLGNVGRPPPDLEASAWVCGGLTAVVFLLALYGSAEERVFRNYLDKDERP